MEIYDISFKDSHESIDKGFKIKDKEKALRMASDMLKERKGLVKQFPGGEISVKNKETGEVIWSAQIPKEM